MAGIAYDQSINQVILDLYNDVNQKQWKELKFLVLMR